MNNQGQTYGQYAEGFVHTVAGPANWNQATHRITITGAPSYNFATTAPTK